MRLVQERNPGADAVRVQYVVGGRGFKLADGYCDLDGQSFVDYYCKYCAEVKLSQNRGA